MAGLVRGARRPGLPPRLLRGAAFPACVIRAVRGAGAAVHRPCFPTPTHPRDLGLCRGLSPRDGIVVLAVFAVTHLVFWALGRVSGQSGQAEALFAEMALDGPLLPAFGVLFSSVVLAPVCEEILYRGVVLRPIHDHLARRGRASTGAAAGIAASTLLFAMPHLATDTLDIMALGYLVTGIGLGLTYVLTGSLTATMIGHSLQSTVAFAQILLLGRGDADVHPLLWALVLGGPLWVWLGARAVRAVLPRGEATRKIFE